MKAIHNVLPDGKRYCPAEQLSIAISKLKQGQQLDFYEEYAIESIFHESVHSRMHFASHGLIDEKVFEICTQLYAREVYPSVLSAYNVDAVNQASIRINGLGYRSGCNTLRGVFTNNGSVDSQAIMKVLLSEDRFTALMSRMNEIRLSQSEIKGILKNL